MKYISNETINHFRKFLSRLYKKGDESLLSRKKKREETKQKSKLEKVKINNMNNMNPYNNYYQGMYLPPPPLQINNQNPAYFNEYQNIYYLNPQAYPIPPGMVPQYLPPQYMYPPKNLEESINAVYERGIVNNIIAAFFIKECQDKMKNNGKRKVPVSTVDLNNNETDNNNNEENQDKLNNKDNNNENNNEVENKDDKNDENEEKKEEIKEEENEKNEHSNDNELTRPNVV